MARTVRALLLSLAVAALVAVAPAHGTRADRTQVVVTLDAPSLARAVRTSRVLTPTVKARRLDLSSATSRAYLAGRAHGATGCRAAHPHPDPLGEGQMALRRRVERPRRRPRAPGCPEARRHRGDRGRARGRTIRRGARSEPVDHRRRRALGRPDATHGWQRREGRDHRPGRRPDASVLRPLRIHATRQASRRDRGPSPRPR